MTEGRRTTDDRRRLRLEIIGRSHWKSYFFPLAGYWSSVVPGHRLPSPVVLRRRSSKVLYQSIPGVELRNLGRHSR